MIALPEDRHRPLHSFYGRVNRAAAASEIALARARMPSQKLASEQRVAKLREELDKVNTELHSMLERSMPKLVQLVAPDSMVTPAKAKSAAWPAIPSARGNRVDVVGLIGPQIARVKKSLGETKHPPHNVRFIEAGQGKVRDPAPCVVLVSGFTDHKTQDAYASAGAVREFVTRPTAQRVVGAVLRLSNMELQA